MNCSKGEVKDSGTKDRKRQSAKEGEKVEEIKEWGVTGNKGKTRKEHRWLDG